MAECAVRVAGRRGLGAGPGGICWRGLGGEVDRRTVAGADGRVLAWPVATVMMGDIGEEITEIELEPLPGEMPAEPAAEPVPG